MRRLIRSCAGGIFDLRVVVGICGVLLSIVTHELFHIIVHWGEISSVHIFPDHQAIVEVVFTPANEYDLVVEEAIAYGITMITLILTAMLISDISDARDTRTVKETILPNEPSLNPGEDEQLRILEYLSGVLDTRSTL